MKYFKYLTDNPVLLAAIVVAVGIVAGVWLYRYTTPFEQCRREMAAKGYYELTYCRHYLN